jgi:hypothetical protein
MPNLLINLIFHEEMEIKNLPIQFTADITPSNALKMYVAAVST